MGLHLGGLMSGLQSAASIVASLAGQTITALKFVSSQVSGSNAFEVSTTGARVKFGPGTTDYAESDGATRVTFAGNITGGGLATNSSIGEVALTGSASYLYFSNAGAAAGVIYSNMSSANASSTNAAIKVYTANALDATDLVFSIATMGNTIKLFGVTYAGSLVIPNTDSTGTPGAASINQAAGRSSIALGAATITITNSLVTAASMIFISPLARDATGLLPAVTTTGAGSFIVTTTANCTANLPFNWWVLS